MSLFETESTLPDMVPTLSPMSSRPPRFLGLTQRRAVDLCRVAGCLCSR